MYNEKNISTKSDKEKTGTWFSCENGNQKRTQDPGPAAGKRQTPAGSGNTIEIGGIKGERFPKELRISRKTEFDAVFKKGRRIVAGQLLLFVKDNGFGIPRIGIAAGKRYGKAVERNRARRIVREIFRRFIRKALPAVDIVVVVRSNRGRLGFDRCLEDMRSGLKRYLQTSKGD